MKFSMGTPEVPPNKSGSRGTTALVLIALVLFGALVALVPYTPAALKAGQDIFSQLGSSVSTTTQTGNSGTDHSYSPLIQNGSANIQFPSDYTTLENYALGLINNDRANPPQGLQAAGAVTLSPNQAGQQHADSMLRYDYFSHFDTQGFKPYMRYSLLGGKGADAENIAFILDSSAHFSTPTLENAINALEHAMVYNDSACCNNGHRDNILNPLHNKVSIGVAYDSTHIYFDEEFENDYMTLNFSVSSSNYITMSGVPIQSSVTSQINSIYIAFDSTPQTETVQQLDSGPHEYGPGMLVGGVLPPCNQVLGGCGQFQTGTTVYADTWTINQNVVKIAFSLQNFIKASGAGVYTVYVITGSDTNSAITTISVFVS